MVLIRGKCTKNVQIRLTSAVEITQVTVDDRNVFRDLYLIISLKTTMVSDSVVIRGSLLRSSARAATHCLNFETRLHVEASSVILTITSRLDIYF